MINLAILASGSGTNAEALINHFKKHESVRVRLVLTNKVNAGVLERAKRLNVPSKVFSKAEMESEEFIELFKENQIDLIILAGFLLKIPPSLIAAYPDRIINIHPALLPNYGGKGMYGSHVHESVIANKESQSGITIHLVNEVYDDGRHLFQASVDISPSDSPDTLANKIHVLEHQHYPKVVEQYVKELLGV